MQTAPLNFGELGGTDLPTGTVTLLLADVEGSSRLWESDPTEMAVALVHLNAVVNDLVALHGGVRPLEQGEGDSFVLAFAKASDAVTCALELQRAPLTPIRLRIGIHTGEIQLRDEFNYAGPTINRAARVRDLAHGGQTVLTGATEVMVLDRLPDGAWLADLGSHALRDLPRRERVMQLNHPEVCTNFPPLRIAREIRTSRLPVQLTRFVGRVGQVVEVAGLLRQNRLVTLTGAGGAGKTRLSVELAASAEPDFGGEVHFVDLAPVTDPAVVPVVVARSLDLADQPGFGTMESIRRYIADRRMLMVLDNCEHLLDAVGALCLDLLRAGPQVSMLATSREPIGVPGEFTWRVPSLSPDDEAVELFVDRARLARSDFALRPEQVSTVTEICVRLDGMPLAIELAAARIRTLSPSQILASLRSSFRVLTGGSRTAVRRQQTLSASIDWSHSLLTEPERVLFRRLAVFTGGLDLEAAHAIGAHDDAERVQLLDLLGLLVDKSLVVAEESGEGMRYRLLETVRQYGMEKLAASGEADTVRTRHRDYYATTAARLGAGMAGDGTPLIQWADAEIDNLRAAFNWSREIADFETALTLVSSLRALWLKRGRFREGLAGFDAVFTDERYDGEDVAPSTWVTAVADAAQLAVWLAVPASKQRAQHALAVAAETGDQHLLARIKMAYGMLNWEQLDVAAAYLSDAAELSRGLGDLSMLAEALGYLTFTTFAAGDPRSARASGEEGWAVADSIGDGFVSRYCRVFLGGALVLQGLLADAARLATSVVDDARTVGDKPMEAFGLMMLGQAHVFMGSADSAESAEATALEIASILGGFHEDSAYVVLAGAALVRGDARGAVRACAAALQNTYLRKELFIRCILPMAEALLSCGEAVEARRWADESVATFPGTYRVSALISRARIALAQGETQQAERDVHDALSDAQRTGGYLRVSDALECLAALTASTAPPRAARLLGAADGIRQRQQEAGLAVFDAECDTAVSRLRQAMGEEAFDAARAEGESLTTSEAIAFAQRGRGERKRPACGWESLTPTECNVVRLLSDGLGNRDIAARLFISPRTVQTHLTHIYGKLNLSSRLQVVQEAARHAG